MLEQLFTQGRIWQRHHGDAPAAIDTGFEAMNQHLPGGGWPAAGVVEIIYPHLGLGELSLLLPCLRQLSQRERWLAWVAPPWRPNAAALVSAGVDIRKLLLVSPKNGVSQHRDTLWSLEECIKSGAVSAILGWPQQLKPDQARRLHLCASQYQVPCFLFKQQPVTQTPASTACALRLQLQAIDTQRVTVSVLKQRHGWPPPPFTLTLKRYSPFRYRPDKS